MKPDSTRPHRDGQYIDWLSDWYAFLNAHDEFQKQLKDLFVSSLKYETPKRGEIWDSEKQLAEQLQRQQRRASKHRTEDESARIASHLTGDLDSRAAPHLDLVKAAEAFARRWRLPRRAWAVPSDRGVGDLWFSMNRWDRESQPELVVGSVQAIDTIHPHTITVEAETFEFDPTEHDRGWARQGIDRYLKKARSAALEQVRRAVEEARSAGWKGWPPSHADRDERRRLLQRVFQRAILNWTWTRIVGEEGGDTGSDSEDVRNTIKGTKALARTLGIPLPSRRGRKPKGQTGASSK